MAIVFDHRKYLDWKLMKPGESVEVHCHFFEMYVLVMSESGDLKLDVEASKPRDELAQFIRCNRNVQEVVFDQDIDMEQMEVYVREHWRFIGHDSSLILYPKAPDVPMNPVHGEVYHTNVVRYIEPLENNQPAITLDSERESA